MLSSLNSQPPVATITSDASGSWGCGAICGQDWFQLSWDCKLEHSHISVKELTPIIIAVALWGKKWQGKLLLVQSDNTAAVAMVNSQTSHETEAMHLIQCLTFILARFQLMLSAVHFSLCIPTGRAASDGDSNSTGRIAARSTLRLDLDTVDQDVEHYFSRGLATTTHKTYQAGQRYYLEFCEQVTVSPLPASESTLRRFVTVLANNGIAHSTVKVYLSATRQLHIAKGLPEPRMEKMPRLSQVLKGIQNLDLRGC